MAGPQLVSSDIEGLRRELKELERRVAALEEHRPSIAADPPPPPAPIVVGEASWHPAGIAAVLGRAILALAGAYLLRALAGSGALPLVDVMVSAVCYAVLWLWLAARRREHCLEWVVYTAAAALIFAPLLWESTVRLNLLPHPATAALIFMFPLLSIWLGAATAIPVLFSLATAIALMIRTGDLLPFVWALLVMATISEASRSGPVRAVSAIAADFAVWTLIWIHNRTSMPAGTYNPSSGLAVAVSPIALCGVYAASLGLRKRFSVADVLQVSIAVTLVVYGAPRVLGGAVVGLACVAAALAFRRSFARFGPVRLPQALSLPLGLIGSALLATGGVWAVLCAVAAPAVSFAGARRPSRLLDFYGVALLTAAAIACGFPAQMLKAVSTDRTGVSVFAPLLILGSAVACYFASSWMWTRAVSAAFAVASACTALLLAIAPAGEALPVIVRSIVFCSAAAIIAVAQARTGRLELLWISYGTLAVSGVRLLVSDFRAGSLAAIAFSLVCYGAALILLPWIRVKARSDEQMAKNLIAATIKS